MEKTDRNKMVLDLFHEGKTTRAIVNALEELGIKETLDAIAGVIRRFKATKQMVASDAESPAEGFEDEEPENNEPIPQTFVDRLRNLPWDKCQWVTSSVGPRDPEFSMCGKPRSNGVYCAEHTRLVWAKTTLRVTVRTTNAVEFERAR